MTRKGSACGLWTFLARSTVVQCIVFFSCFLNPTVEEAPDSPHPGMIQVLSNGKAFTQGWNDSLAVQDEKPGMTVFFTYNYWLDTVEVTQKQFFALTGRNPVPENSQYGQGGDFPVYNVSWYDAVLFCNARSKADRLDTIYVYTGKKILATGSVCELVGVYTDFSRDGYRLPTEAEWEFAARQASSMLPLSTGADSCNANRHAWWVRNSANRTHPVATKVANVLGFYDLAGNVFEWSNDWKCAYTGQEIMNPLGGQLPGGEYEKVVKGGSYRDDLVFLRPSHRRAAYPTVASSANEYVGFRCARGVVPDGRYIGQEWQQGIANTVAVAAGSAAVRSFIGADAVRVVFVNVTGNDRTLCCADFAAAIPFIREYHDDKNVHLPTISPDGRYVAYCSAGEGCNGSSVITIRSLDSLKSPRIVMERDGAYFPRWWINPATGDTALMFVNSAVSNANSLWETTKTYIRKISGGKPAGSATEICRNGGFHDGRSANGRFLITSYQRLMVHDCATGGSRTLFQFPHNGKDPNGSTQVCNASIAPDTGNAPRCLFLDFGYPLTSAITGSTYGIHQYLFVGRITDTIVGYLNVPESEKSWEYPEWTNHPRFAVSAARNSEEQSRAIYLVDLEEKKSLRIISGCELRDPYCHIGSIFGNTHELSMDSLGRYNDPVVNGGQEYLNYKLRLFWQKCSRLDCVFIGQSYIYCGIDCSAFEHYSALNMGFIGCGLLGYSTIISNYILPHAPKLKVIGINVPFDYFANELGEETPTYFSGSIGQSKGYLYDLHHNFWRNGFPAGFIEHINKLSNATLLQAVPFDSSGFAHFDCKGWGPQKPGCFGSITWTVHDSNYRKNFNALINLIETVSSYGVHLLMINVPQSPRYKTTDHYFLSGPSWETAREVLAQLKTLESRYPKFHLYDAYNDGNHDYADEDAYNDNHLCTLGAKKLTKRIDSLLHVIFAAERP